MAPEGARRAPKRSLSSRRIRHSFKGAGSASEGARLAPLKGAGKGANKGLEGVSTPKRARGAPRELPLIRSQKGSEEEPSLQEDPAQREPEGPQKGSLLP